MCEAKHESILSSLNRDGYVLVKKFINSKTDLHCLIDAANRIVNSVCENEQITKRMRVNGHHKRKRARTWGIDDFLCDFRIDELRLLDSSDLLLLAKRYFSRQDISLGLNRIHLQRLEYLHKLFWHHDADRFNTNLVANIYLAPEIGFRLMRKNHPINNETNLVSVSRGEYFSLLRGYQTIEADQGDLLLFDGRLFHQPYNRKKRLHLHFVFTRNSNLPAIDRFSNYKFSCEDRNTPVTHGGSFVLTKIRQFVKVVLDVVERNFIH